MARLIDPKELQAALIEWRDKDPYKKERFLVERWIRKVGINVLIRFVSAFSTIEAEPVRHGRWEECDWVEFDGHSECIRYPKKGRVCTNCRNAFKKEFIDAPRVRYCPHCGAKMDGDSHE